MTPPGAGPTYSQIGQDLWVTGPALRGKRGGYFVDVGAYDGVQFSNTLLLEREYGWTGLCVEASETAFESLRRNRACAAVRALVADRPRRLDFLDGMGMLSHPFEAPASWRQRWAYFLETRRHVTAARRKAAPARLLKMRSETLGSLLDRHRAPAVVDYLSLDIEGLEQAILDSFPHGRYRFRCMTVEYKNPSPSERREFFARMAGRGYRLAGQLFSDCFFVHEEACPGYDCPPSWFEDELTRRIDERYLEKPELAHVGWVVRRRYPEGSLERQVWDALAGPEGRPPDNAIYLRCLEAARRDRLEGQALRERVSAEAEALR